MSVEHMYPLLWFVRREMSPRERVLIETLQDRVLDGLPMPRLDLARRIILALMSMDEELFLDTIGALEVGFAFVAAAGGAKPADAMAAATRAAFELHDAVVRCTVEIKRQKPKARRSSGSV